MEREIPFFLYNRPFYHFLILLNRMHFVGKIHIGILTEFWSRQKSISIREVSWLAQNLRRPKLFFSSISFYFWERVRSPNFLFEAANIHPRLLLVRSHMCGRSESFLFAVRLLSRDQLWPDFLALYFATRFFFFANQSLSRLYVTSTAYYYNTLDF